MNRLTLKVPATALALAGLLTLASCTEEKKPEPKADSTGVATIVDVTPGEAGGVIEETVTASVTVKAIDKAARNITLADEDGSTSTFTAGPEIRNFDQLKVGDKVTATVLQRLTVLVRSGQEEPGVTHSAGMARAPKGAKPGIMVAETYELTATVKSINATDRTAVLQFADNVTRSVKIRPDVELSRYKAGDTVVIRVNEALSLLAEKP